VLCNIAGASVGATPNARNVNISSSLSSGDNDLYTVPPGRAAFLGRFTIHNHSGGSVTYYIERKLQGVYQRLQSNAFVTAGQTSNAGSFTYIFQAGETLAVNCDTDSAANFAGCVLVEFDLAGGALSSPRLSGLQAGDNTLYTVSPGKSAVGVGPDLVQTLASLSIANTTGGNVTYIVNFVRSGQSPGVANQAFKSTVATGNVSFTNLVFSLGAGDFISINASNGLSGQFAWVTVLEYAAG
jgi:hypothetical protein